VIAAKPDDDFSKSTLILPSAGEPAAPAPEPVTPAADMMTLDFDLGVPEPAPAVAAKSDSKPVAPASDAHDVITLDFDLGSNSGILSVEEPSTLDFDLNVGTTPAFSENSAPETNFSAEGTMIMPDPMNVMDASFDLGVLEMPQAAPAKSAVAEAPKKSSEMSLDFDFDMPPPVVAAKPAIDPAATVIAGPGLMAEDDDSGSLDFDVDLGASMFMTQVMEQPKFDITTIDLDLAPPKSAGGVVEAAVASIFAPAPAAAEHDQDWEEANTKLDLAKAYEEMGDADGASELLREIIAGAPADLVAQAKAMLAGLSA
jgi:pilus assembly protein FimV